MEETANEVSRWNSMLINNTCIFMMQPEEWMLFRKLQIKVKVKLSTIEVLLDSLISPFTVSYSFQFSVVIFKKPSSWTHDPTGLTSCHFPRDRQNITTLRFVLTEIVPNPACPWSRNTSTHADVMPNVAKWHGICNVGYERFRVR